MKDDEVSELIDELRKRLIAKMMGAVNSPEIKEVLDELKARKVSFKSLGGIFYDLPQGGKEIIKDLERYVGERMNQIMKEPKATEKIEILRQYGYEVVGSGILGLVFLVYVESDKDWLEHHGIRWN